MEPSAGRPSLLAIVLLLAMTERRAMAMFWKTEAYFKTSGHLFPQIEATGEISFPFVVRRSPVDGAIIGDIAALDRVSNFAPIVNSTEEFVLVDLDHDRHKDLVFTKNGGLTSKVLWAQASTEFGKPFRQPQELHWFAGSNVTLRSPVDLDGDTWADLVFVQVASDCSFQTILALHSQNASLSTIATINTTGLLEPCLPVLIGTGRTASGKAALVVSEGIACFVLVSNGTSFDWIPMPDCPGSRSASSTWALFTDVGANASQLVVQETTGKGPDGEATGRTMTTFNVDTASRTVAVSGTLSFGMDDRDPVLFHLMDSQSPPQIVMFSRTGGEVSLCGPLVGSSQGQCSRQFKSSYAIGSIVVSNEEHRGPTFTVLFQRLWRDTLPKVSWLNAFLNVQRDRTVFFELITFSEGTDRSEPVSNPLSRQVREKQKHKHTGLASFWVGLALGLVFSAAVDAGMMALYWLDRGRDIRIQIEGEMIAMSPEREERIADGAHKRRIITHCIVASVLVLISACAPFWSPEPARAAKILTAPTIGVLLIVLAPLDIALIVAMKKGIKTVAFHIAVSSPANSPWGMLTRFLTQMLLACALVLAATVAVMSIGILYEPAGLVVGLMWSIMIVMLFLLTSFDLAWIQKIIPPEGNATINRHFKRYEKIFQVVLFALLIVGLFLVCLGSPMEFIVMRGGMTVIALSFSTLLTFLPLIIAKDVATTRSFTVVLSALSLMSLAAAIVCVSLTWPLCQNVNHACPRPSAFSGGIFPLWLSLLGIFVTAAREVYLVSGFRGTINRTLDYSTETHHRPYRTPPPSAGQVIPL